MATGSSAPPAIVQSEEQAELQQSHATWAALATFHRAPCLRESLATGGAGGVAIFALRWLSTRSAGGPAPIAAAATWGGFAGALVFGPARCLQWACYFQFLGDEVRYPPAVTGRAVAFFNVAGTISAGRWRYSRRYSTPSFSRYQ